MDTVHILHHEHSLYIEWNVIYVDEGITMKYYSLFQVTGAVFLTVLLLNLIMGTSGYSDPISSKRGETGTKTVNQNLTLVLLKIILKVTHIQTHIQTYMRR